MKRKIAALLVLCMLASWTMPAAVWADDAQQAESSSLSAAQTASQDNSDASSTSMSDSAAVSDSAASFSQSDAQSGSDTSESAPAQSSADEQPQEDQKYETQKRPQHSGAVRLNITSALPVGKATTFHVLLKGPTMFQSDIVLPASIENGSSASVLAGNLANGTYTLIITAQGYAKYQQTIEVNDMLYEAKLYTGALAGYDYREGQKHPGILMAGDVNASGAVDDADVKMLVNAIDTGSQDAAMDLNGSGEADLADLQMLSLNYKHQLDTKAYLTTGVSPQMAEVGVQKGAVVGGSLANLQNGDVTGVQLQSKGAEITPDNPVELSFDFGAEPVDLSGMTIDVPVGKDNAVSQAMFRIVYETDQGEQIMEIPYLEQGVMRLSGGGQVTRSADGTLVVDFGGQVAVKKVTFTLNKTQKSTNLAEISKVEFLNDMENRIPPPRLDVPKNLRAEAHSKAFTAVWDPAVNITGYEVEVSHGEHQEVHRTTSTVIRLSNFNGDKMQNNTEYTVRVQSVNGSWKSGYSEPITITPKATKKPPAPDELSLTGQFRRITASWKKTEDADTYNLYYRKKGEQDYTAVQGIEATSYTVNDLEDQAVYEVYVTGVNELGEGDPSIVSEIATVSRVPAKLPNYKLINTSNGEGVLSNHITEAVRFVGKMVGSPLDADGSKTALGVFDNHYDSYYIKEDWDDGATYPKTEGGIRVKLDKKYHIGMITLAQPEDIAPFSRVRILAKNDSGAEKEIEASRVSIVQRSDSNGRKHYMIKIAGGVETDQLRVCLGYAYGYWQVQVAEMRLYEYDSVEDEIMALYADPLHLTLKAEVNAEMLAVLEERLNTENAGELHPDYELLKKELEHAKGILNQENLGDVIRVNTEMVPKRDNGKGFTGLNAWQPLGISAAAGEQIVIYVGSEGLANGQNTPLQLVAAQQHAESSKPAEVVANLKIGRNELTIPELQTIAAEKGGALYIQIAGNANYDANRSYAVRVDGGHKIPVLNLRGVTDEATRRQLVKAYLAALEGHVAALEGAHQAEHAASELTAVNAYDYDPKNCVLNTTDLVFDHMMLSVPASQVLAGLKGDADTKTQQLMNTAAAFDQLMLLFYQHKGLTNLDGAQPLDRLPVQQLNIRYQRMFAGAFMYASGDHIGIEWDSVPGAVRGTPVQLDEHGKYLSGSLFGWGIGHEIGHQLNQSVYAVAEITNNYFAQLAVIGEAGAPRFDYERVYRKVTSNAVGPDGNVFTQLAMYWQLHLAYDKGYEYQMYQDYQTLLDSRFFARVDTYARDPKRAPGTTPLTLTKDTDQNLMRLASAAAQKNLTDFFVRWGMVPTEETAAYMQQFDAETRALYYGTDAARNYRFENAAQQTELTFADKEAVSKTTSAKIGAQPNQVVLSLGLSEEVNADAFLGYEIVRVVYHEGAQQRQVVGFTTADSFTDTVTSFNNRTITYEVSAVDRFMNRSLVKALAPLKIQHDGSYGKEDWTVSTNMVSVQDTTPPAGEDEPCAPEQESAIHLILDGKADTTYTGQVEQGEAQITVGFRRVLPVTAIKYTLSEGTPIERAVVEISTNGTDWKTLKEAEFTLDPKTKSATVYFPNQEGSWVETYDASMLRLTVKAPVGSEISISELDVLGPTGDNVELLTDGIGILKTDYVYEESTGAKIPKGSTVFIGEYKGNPAYNVVMLFDEQGNVVSSRDPEGNYNASQIILAPVPEHGDLGETTEGRWVYWIEPGAEFAMPKSIRVELYRVDHAETNEGQRLVSDTLTVKVPEKLPEITINS